MSRTGSLVSRGDDGFTLVELIIAVVILGVITTPLASVVIGFLRNTDETSARMLESHDAQIASAYWAQDVASIGTHSATSPFPLTQSVETGVAYNAGLYPCGPSGTPDAIVRLAWDDSSGPGAATVVRIAYVVQTVSGQGELHRLRCNGSAAVVKDVTIARELDPATPPAVACSTACTAAPGVPQSVTLALTLKNPDNRNTAYAVTLTGQRRQS